jgi:membrane protease YdiL (CAAX protease family)
MRWSRLPILLRSVLVGLLVTAVPTLLWGVLLQISWKLSPRTPWAAILMAVFLFFYWKYLQGWGWPHSLAPQRRNGLRAPALAPAVWGWSLLAGGFGLAASIVLFIVAHRLIRWPVAAAPDFSTFSAATIFVTLLMSAVVAGFSEEAGFRGYMQSPLERRYSPASAILIISVLFGLLHLSHGFFAPAILFDIGWGALYGLLAWRSGSIVPALVLHSAADFLEFMLVWKLPHRTPAPLVWQAPPDARFWAECALAVVMTAVSVWAFRRLGSPSNCRSHSLATAN